MRAGWLALMLVALPGAAGAEEAAEGSARRVEVRVSLEARASRSARRCGSSQPLPASPSSWIQVFRRCRCALTCGE